MGDDFVRFADSLRRRARLAARLSAKSLFRALHQAEDVFQRNAVGTAVALQNEFFCSQLVAHVGSDLTSLQFAPQ